MSTAVNLSWGADRVLRALDEVRDSGNTGEIRRIGERQLAPLGATPLDLVTAITPVQGIYRPPEMPDLG